MPSVVTKIYKYGLAHNQKITSVTFGGNVELGSSAFSYSYNLTQLKYNGTINEFNNLIKHNSWKSNLQATSVSCYDGVIEL